MESGRREAPVIWMFAEDETKAACRTIQQWMNRSNPLVVAPSKVSAYQDAWDLAIITPSAESAPEVCKSLLSIDLGENAKPTVAARGQ